MGVNGARVRRGRLGAWLVTAVAGLGLAVVPPAGASGAPTLPSAVPGVQAAAPTLTPEGPDTIRGAARYEGTLTAVVAWRTPRATSGQVQWHRDYTPIPGATGSTYRVTHEDVGHRIRYVVTVGRAGYASSRHLSQPTPVVGDATPRRRTVTYDVRVDGSIPGFRVEEFGVQSGETLADPRGWRAGGTHFQRTASGARSSFTLVLATADRLPRYSGECSTQWSCRVGRNVIINYTRWMEASPSWNAARGTLRDYRHMVVNHEVGHFLGRGHVGCSAPGNRAPVMMQQSKGLDGCRFNPWPLPGER